MQRLFKPYKRFIIASNVLIAFISLRETAAVLTNTFQCWPVQYFYNKTIKGGHCMKARNKFYITMGALSMIEDVMILVMPQPVIWGLHLSMRKKVGLAIVFSLGSLYVPRSMITLLTDQLFISVESASLTRTHNQGGDLQSSPSYRIPQI